MYWVYMQNINLRKEHLLITLGVFGLIPFVLFAYYLGVEQRFAGITADVIFIGYSSAILAFLGGALWGKYLQICASPLASKLLVASNCIVLVAWLSIIISQLNIGMALIILVIGYISVLSIELRFRIPVFNADNRSYLILRTILTCLVVLIHISVLYQTNEQSDFTSYNLL